MGDLTLKGATSGQITLTPTAVAGTNTLTLPAKTGNLITSADSGTVTGTMIASLPVGSIVQIVYGSTATSVLSTSSSYADTGLTASITPKSSSNKILILVDHASLQVDGATLTSMSIKLLRGTTDLSVFEINGGYSAGAQNYVGASSMSYLDSPATTSLTTYKTQFKRNVGSGNCRVQGDSGLGSITLLEVVA